MAWFSQPTAIDSFLSDEGRTWTDSALAILRLTLKALKTFGPLCPPLQTAADGFLAVVDGCTVCHAQVHLAID
jgi:hypothetical protein